MLNVLLATGKKAEGMVKDAIKSVDIVKCDVLTQDIGIAAFSTPKTLKRALERHFKSEKPDLILVSGLCKSDFSSLEKEIGTPIRLGPKHAYDLSDVLPFAEEIQFSSHIAADEFIATKRKEHAKTQLDELERHVNPNFELKGVKIGSGARMKVCAEIVDATLLSADAIQRKMDYYMENGADIIDLGVHIGAKPDEVKKAVKAALSATNAPPLSVDTLDAELILAGIETGVDMVLSLTKENIPVVSGEIANNDIAAVVIPDSSPESLFTNIKMAKAHGIKRLIADPVLNAIGYGIANSLYHYYLFRLKDKSTPLFFGVGNVTELIDADSEGVNATLAGIASELNADILFAPEHSDKARGSVRELRVASEMMMLSKARKSAPKDIGLDLLMLKEKRRRQIIKFHDKHSITAIETEGWKLDPKGCFRIGICDVEGKGSMIYAEHLPTKKRIVGRSAKAVMDTILRLDLVSLLEHATYLSKELTKAELALRLDRSYEQDEELFISFLMLARNMQLLGVQQ
ncbi:MAG TPA: dihydropteroate synthase-like protein [Methanophagales archaeon]|nr:dihydropteroate synthase-like protein [Methanophagales archaeon]